MLTVLSVILTIGVGLSTGMLSTEYPSRSSSVSSSVPSSSESVEDSELLLPCSVTLLLIESQDPEYIILLRDLTLSTSVSESS